MIELDELLPEQSLMTMAGHKVTITPFKFGHFAKVLRFIKKYQTIFFGSQNLVLDIIAHGEEGLNDLAELVEFSTDKDRNWLDQLPGDEAIELILKVFEVNANFFIQKINQGSLALAGKLQPGQTSLPDSSTTNIPGEISNPTP